MHKNNIVIVSQSHLCRNPRVLKEAIALYKAGYQVIILTAIYSDELLQEDFSLIYNTSIKYEFYSDLRKVNFSSLADRCILKLFMLVRRFFTFESKFSLGYGINKLKRMWVSYHAVVYIMHQELATVIGAEMFYRYNVIFDFEDWYSEDLLQDARKSRPIGLLKKAESAALHNGLLTFTTSKAMARALAECYKSEKCPEVIYNSFDAAGLSGIEREQNSAIRLYWFSQTIGEGRGLEFFLSAMGKSAGRWELYLRGNITPSYQLHLTDLISPKDKLIILPLQKNIEILNGMADYHVGLALEPNQPANKDLTISNKFFHYLAAGLPVIASRTSGHQEIGLKHPDFIFMYEQGDENSLVALLNRLEAKFAGQEISEMRQSIINAYRSHYTWEIEERKLVNMISKSIEESRHSTD